MARILISLPDELLAEIDAKVARRFTTRSAFLRRAARDALDRPDPGRIRSAVGRGRAAIATLRVETHLGRSTRRRLRLKAATRRGAGVCSGPRTRG
ncbi:MAG TPA: ribbon-helix-helix domain-containing protein, partial [Candidatus Limnocylindrales bacterium]|nr:ribbon-helix-helix domain-containing protein [Candidatus Limnocylindrales bacterium]